MPVTTILFFGSVSAAAAAALTITRPVEQQLLWMLHTL